MEKGADQNAPHPKNFPAKRLSGVSPARRLLPKHSPTKISPCLRASVSSVFSAAGPFHKGKTVTDRHSGRTTNQANTENHANRFADMKKREGSGCPVGARASRPRGARNAENKRKGQCFL